MMDDPRADLHVMAIGYAGQTEVKPILSNNYLAHLLSEHESHHLTAVCQRDGSRKLICKDCDTTVIDSAECDLCEFTNEENAPE